MRNKLTRRQMLGLALLPSMLLLSLAIGWLYLTVQSGYGSDAAVLTLTAVTIIILALICKGIQYAMAIEKAVQRHNTTQIDPSETRNVIESFTSGIPGQVLSQHPQDRFKAEILAAGSSDKNHSRIYTPDSQSYKRRGKQSRFPISKITKAVLKWEQRDSRFTPINLTEFLEQEFGCGPDGILLMAPTTFYDWRRRVLSDLKYQSSGTPALPQGRRDDVSAAEGMSQNKNQSSNLGVEEH